MTPGIVMPATTGEGLNLDNKDEELVSRDQQCVGGSSEFCLKQEEYRKC